MFLFIARVHNDIAAEVTKVGGGHPTKEAIRLLRENVERDPHWYSGKVTASAMKRGPKPTFKKVKKDQVAKSAMSLKRKGFEPSVNAVLAQTLRAATNPRTGKLYTPLPS